MAMSTWQKELLKNILTAVSAFIGTVILPMLH